MWTYLKSLSTNNMRTYKYKTLDGVCSANKLYVLTLTNVLGGRVYSETKQGFINLKLDSKEEDRFLKEIASLIWGKRVDDDKVFNLRHRYKELGVYADRLWYACQYHRFDYCAGQDYRYEMRNIRKLLK